MKLHNLFHVIQLWKLSTIQSLQEKYTRLPRKNRFARLDLVVLVIELGLLFKL